MSTIAVVAVSGNLHSVARAVAHAAPDHRIVLATTPAEVDAADRVVFPGQGAMHDCMRRLGETGLRDALERARRSRPFMGVCVGLQMLFEEGDESDAGTPTAGLGWLRGRVERLPSGLHDASGARIKVPHMGWNRVAQGGPEGRAHPMWDGIADGEHFYFVHSYVARPVDPAVIVGESEHGVRFTCAVAVDNIFAAQFHPEKSAATGLRLYANFARWAP